MSAPASVVSLPHGRVPPHNLDAEKSLLGGILLDSQAFAEVVEVVRADEFYRDAHRKVFEAMSVLFGKGQPIDRITVKDELTAQGAFEAVGGDEFIDLLDKIVPTAANLAYYAKIVHEKALARRLIEAASTIAQLGYEQHGEVGDFADECERRIFAVTEQRNTVSFEAVKPVIARVFKNIEALYERQEEITGIPSGFADLDRLTSGFQPGDLVILAARPSMGKAQPLDAPVLTPAGYVPMGEIQPGSLVIGRDGKPHRVLAVFPQGDKEIFRVQFTDGGRAECCDEHLWSTTTRTESRRPGGEGSVKSLAEIRRTLHVAGEPERLNHRVPTVAPVEFGPRERALLLPPYLLGLLLGDGSFRGVTIRFDGAEADVHQRLRDQLPVEDTVTRDGLTARVHRRREEPTHQMHGLLTALAAFEPGMRGPSIRELCEATETPYPNVVHGRLVSLRAKGLVEWEPNRTRSVRLTDAGRRRAAESCPPPLRRSSTRLALEHYGLDGLSSKEKFIPEDYLYAAVTERLDLLRGLLDTDGHVIVPGGQAVEFTTTSPRLADGVVWLVRSLGGIVSRREKTTSYEYLGEQRTGAPATRLRFWFANGIVPVSSEKHLSRWRTGPGKFVGRFIESAEPIGKKPCQCILIDSEDHLYVTSDFVVTHNTACVLNITTHVGCRAQYQGKRCGVGMFSLEMPKEQLVMRMLASEARVDSQRIRTGRLIESDWAKLAQAAGVLADANIHIDDTPAVSALELRAKCRRLFARYEGTDQPIRLIVVDYLQLMRGNERIDSREQQISEISRSLKALAKELAIPVVALSQLNRSLEKRPDKRPLMSDLRESGAIEQDADTIMFIYREEVYEKDKEDVKGVAEIIIGKQRNGPIGTANLAFIHEHTRFENLARDYTPGGGE
ncbi:MAG TPA: replicative DNA helicase [Myxococcales bacterium]|nr:replicative DNA helicase [Myxococcales bacterium]